MLDIQKLTNEELGLLHLGLSRLIEESLDENDKMLRLQMVGELDKEKKIRDENGLQKTLENVHKICEMTGMDESKLREEVIRVYKETHPNKQVNLK